MQKKKILILKLAAIGDVVHTLIIPKAIKEKHPLYEVHYFVQGEVSTIIQNQNYIDKIYIWDENKKNSFEYIKSVIFELQKEKYDLIINLSFTIRNFVIWRYA